MSRAGSSPLRVPLERLQRRPPEREWSAVVRAEELVEAGEELKVADVRVAAASDVSVEVALDAVSEGVMVTGSVISTWSGACARCLEVVESPAVAEVEELFENRPVEGESYQLDEEFADLSPMVRDAVLLELPIGAVPCPHPEPCPHLPHELAAVADPDEPSEGEAAHAAEGEGTGAASGATALADPRWAALDALVFDDEADTTDRAGEPDG